jgi:hypothetical protein
MLKKLLSVTGLADSRKISLTGVLGKGSKLRAAAILLQHGM